MKTVRIGTRDSKLAMVQAHMVQQAIQAYDPGIRAELVAMKTTGDRILDQTLDKIGGKGLFVKELDHALLNGDVDITVHSAKDLPMELDACLPIVAASMRGDALDALVLPQGTNVLDTAKPVGCSSSRRRLQLLALYPGIRVEPVRGNVITRLQKLDEGQYGALVLAAAGLKRLGLEGRISRVFTPKEMLPAACQGILAVQARAGEDMGFLAHFHNESSMLCAKAERAFVRALDGGCSKPCAAYAQIINGQVEMCGMYVSDDESCVRYGTLCCSAQEAEIKAGQMAERLKNGTYR